MRPQIVKILTIVLFLLNSTTLLSQHSRGGKGPPVPTNNRTFPELPIDDSILILILIALVYGAYIAYKRYRTKNSPA